MCTVLNTLVAMIINLQGTGDGDDRHSSHNTLAKVASPEGLGQLLQSGTVAFPPAHLQRELLKRNLAVSARKRSLDRHCRIGAVQAQASKVTLATKCSENQSIYNKTRAEQCLAKAGHGPGEHLARLHLCFALLGAWGRQHCGCISLSLFLSLSLSCLLAIGHIYIYMSLSLSR